jgi:hypothetical protein
LADNPTMHIGENSPEHVAFRMMLLIADVEKREPYGHGEHHMDREWILRTYDQCRDVVKGVGSVTKIVETYAPPSHAGPRSR